MKMQYTKPMLYAETFELTEHITQCAHLNSTVNNGDPDQGCGYALNGRNASGGLNDGPILFLMGLEGGSSCTDAGDPSLVNSGGVLCYNFFVDEGTLMFQS